MQYLNDDMEGLFQRAADNYNLDPGPDSWESIAKKIQEGRIGSAEAPKKKTYRKYIGIMLMVVLLSCGLVIVLKNQGIRPQSGTSNKQVIYALPDKQQTGAKRDYITIKNAQKSPLGYPFKKRNSNSQSAGQTPDIITKDFAGRMGSLYRSKTIQKQQWTQALSGIETNGYPGKNQPEKASGVLQPDRQPLVADPKVYPVIKINSTQKGPIEPRKKVKTLFKKELFLGLIAGVDFSKIKSMPFNKVGFSAGIAGEYKFAKRWSLQSGVIVNKKNYSGQGLEFNMDKVRSAMSGMTINKFQGRSTLVEVPLTAKFYVLKKREHNLFVMAGFASYIMTSEENKYDVMHNGLPEKFSGYYRKNTYHAFAATTFSIGYENKISDNSAISIAPYFDVPLGGVGVGNLPVTSAGLHVVLSTRLR